MYMILSKRHISEPAEMTGKLTVSSVKDDAFAIA